MIRLAFAILLTLASTALAVQPEEQLSDRRMEARARAISAELRCLVCQNQSIDDSDAPLAHDLRMLVRQRLEAGDSDAAARNFIVARYGEYVLLRPRFDLNTALLWLTPLIVLGIGVALALGRARAASTTGAAPLTPDEEDSLKRILAARDGPAAPLADDLLAKAGR